MTIHMYSVHMGSNITSLAQRHGATQSTRGSEWDWEGRPGTHSPFPVDTYPYHGNAVQYCFIDIMAKYKILGKQLQAV